MLLPSSTHQSYKTFVGSSNIEWPFFPLLAQANSYSPFKTPTKRLLFLRKLYSTLFLFLVYLQVECLHTLLLGRPVHCLVTGGGQCFTEGVVQSLTSWALILEQPLCSCDFGQDTEWLAALVSSPEKWDNTSIPTEKGGKVSKAKC